MKAGPDDVNVSRRVEFKNIGKHNVWPAQVIQGLRYHKKIALRVGTRDGHRVYNLLTRTDDGDYPSLILIRKNDERGTYHLMSANYMEPRQKDLWRKHCR